MNTDTDLSRLPATYSIPSENEVGGVNPDTKEPMTWAELRFAFINGSLSVAKFRDKFGCPDTAIRERATKQKWVPLRDLNRRKVHEDAQRIIREKRAKDLVDFNEADVRMARSVRAMAGLRIQQLKDVYDRKPEWEIPASELRNLAQTIETTQRIGRLALGASTSNSEVTGKDGAPLTAPTIIIGGPPEEDEPPATSEELRALEQDLVDDDAEGDEE